MTNHPRRHLKRAKIAPRRPQDGLEELLFRCRNLSSILVRFGCRFGAILGPFWRPFWDQNSSKNRPEIPRSPQEPPRASQEPSRAARRHPRGPKRHPKGTQNEPKGTPKYPKGTQEYQKGTQEQRERSERKESVPKVFPRHKFRKRRALEGVRSFLSLSALPVLARKGFF